MKRRKIEVPGYAEEDDVRKPKKKKKKVKVLNEEDIERMAVKNIAPNIAKRLIVRIRALNRIGERLITIDTESAFTLAEFALPRKDRKKKK